MSEKYIYDEKTGQYVPIDEKQEKQSNDDKLIGILIWAAQFVIPLIASIVGYVYYENKNEYLRNISKEAINFNISSIIYSIIATVFSVITFGIGSFSFIFIAAYAMIIPILGMLKATEMKVYEPHVTIRFLK